MTADNPSARPWTVTIAHQRERACFASRQAAIAHADHWGSRYADGWPREVRHARSGETWRNVRGVWTGVGVTAERPAVEAAAPANVRLPYRDD